MLTDGKRHDVMQALSVAREVATRLCREIDSDPPLPNGQSIRDDLDAIAEAAAVARKNVDEPFRLGVVGMFKAGKSSVINTFLGKSVLREGRVEATATSTVLRFASRTADEQGEIVFRDGRREAMTIPETLEYTDVRSRRYGDLGADERRALQDSIDHVVLHVNAELLRTITLVDTPGFGGSDTGNRKAFQALSYVDAALMIFSADRYGAKYELEIADTLNQTGREIVALMNKIDDGRGARRSEDDIASAETFVRQQFRKIVTDDHGTPLIFRYSATEVAKALAELGNGSTPEQRLEARKRLVAWGYEGSGETDADKGVIAFVRDRYFSSGGTSLYQRKLVTATKSLLSAMTPALPKLVTAQDAESAQAQKERSESAAREQRLREEINPKIARIEAEIGDIIVAQVQPYVRDLEETLVAIIDRQSEIGDLSDILNAFADQEKQAQALEAEFRSMFPASREERLLREVERRINRVLRDQWLYVFEEMHKIDAAVSVPDASKMLKEINDAMRGAILAMTGSLAAVIGSLFIPGGAIVWALLWAASELFGMHFTARHKNKIEDAKRKIKSQLRHYAQQLSDEMAGQAIIANDALADEARKRVRLEIGTIDAKAAAHADAAERWRTIHRDLKREHATLDKHRQSLESS